MDDFLIFNDTETTGFPKWNDPSGNACQPHIVQIGALLVNPDNREIISTLDVIVRPNGWTIPEETTDIHGITTEDAIALGVPESRALMMFLEMWRGRMRIMHNTTFDNRIIRIGTMRYCDKVTQGLWKDGPYYCTMQKARKIMGSGPPSLEDAYEYFLGRPLRQTHKAIDDARACMELYFAIQDHQQLHGENA